MKLFKLTQSDNTGYDTFDSCVVAAESEADAKTIHPSTVELVQWDDDRKMWLGNELGEFTLTWADFPKSVHAEYLGETHLLRGVVVSSFNAC